ncbi:MAG: type IV toxin-antitoxin system AbiEi family antitoxin [Candidatus Roizmanbacteria bacterium]|nr:type IV toxin-antitoxin system AbiEi family antitoxin [Candidatus Roizmanbacteria bacterium]
MRQTILSTKQSELLENLIVAYGHIVTSAHIHTKAKLLWDETQVKNIITKLTTDGWLIRLKRGLYAISDLSNRGFLSLSPYIVANLLVTESYVSFESALSYYGMFDQLTDKVISISQRRYKTVQLNATEYSFVNVQEKWFFGWQEVVIDMQTVRIATAEKALIDMIQFHKSKYSVDMVIEKLRLHQDSIDRAKLNEYLSKMSTSTIKIFGILYDFLGIDSSRLYDLVKNKSGTDSMFAHDKTFNAKLRLYYDQYFDKYRHW